MDFMYEPFYLESSKFLYPRKYPFNFVEQNTARKEKPEIQDLNSAFLNIRKQLILKLYFTFSQFELLKSLKTKALINLGMLQVKQHLCSRYRPQCSCYEVCHQHHCRRQQNIGNPDLEKQKNRHQILKMVCFIIFTK